MDNKQKQLLGEAAVTIVNELSSGKFKVIVPSREDAIEVAEKIIDRLIRIQLKQNVKQMQ